MSHYSFPHLQTYMLTDWITREAGLSTIHVNRNNPDHDYLLMELLEHNPAGNWETYIKNHVIKKHKPKKNDILPSFSELQAFLIETIEEKIKEDIGEENLLPASDYIKNKEIEAQRQLARFNNNNNWINAPLIAPSYFPFDKDGVITVHWIWRPEVNRNFVNCFVYQMRQEAACHWLQDMINDMFLSFCGVTVIVKSSVTFPTFSRDKFNNTRIDLWNKLEVYWQTLISLDDEPEEVEGENVVIHNFSPDWTEPYEQPISWYQKKYSWFCTSGSYKKVEFYVWYFYDHFTGTLYYDVMDATILRYLKNLNESYTFLSQKKFLSLYSWF